ncbi:hypothetical protein T484DRAFT_1920257 [Baffinella frigidus]|nr:hypothetical protein T484DRAFT_1920257 [Cryptophyta sp. CCMP2293]
MAGAGMVARLTVLGSGEEGTGPGVVLSVARVAEYSGEETALMQVLVNCGECACRILNERRAKLSRLSMVLLTRTAPANVVGLPSLLFHLSDRGGAELSVVGPAGVGEYISAIQAFVSRQYPKVSIHPVTDNEDFEWCTEDDDPAPFAWAQHAAPGAGLSVETIPIGIPDSRQASGEAQTKKETQAKGGDEDPKSVAYALSITGPLERRGASGSIPDTNEEKEGDKEKGVRCVVVVVEVNSEPEVP